jgi:hypothetical protein
LSFLSAAYLLALPLIAVPIAIHLYRGRQRDVILWGAMQFLAAAVTKGRRMERLEEWLLMLLRLLAVAALVFALARPMVRSSWLGDQTDRQVILVLDNSLSMSRTVDGESADDRLKDQATELIDSLSASDGVQVLFAAGNEWAMTDDVAADGAGRQQLRDLIAADEPTLAAAELLVSLQSAVHLDVADDLAARRIVVFTDSQAASWQPDASAAWQQLESDRAAAKIPITIEVVDCGLDAEEIDNLAVTRIASARSLVRPGDTLEVAAEVTNLGNLPSDAMSVEWLVGGKVVESTRVSALRPLGRTRARATLRLAEPGIHAVTCRIDSTDQVALDQENTVVVEVADELPVLVVESRDGANADISAADLFAAALGYKNDEPQPWHAVYRPDVISAAELPTQPLSSYRAIVINDVAQFDRETLDRIDTFVRSGGGLWMALGSAVDPQLFARDWYGDGDGLAPLALDSLEVVAKPDDAAATIHPPTRDHPAAVQLANTTQLDIDEARLRQYWRFTEDSAGERAVSTVLESGNGRPLVVENFVGQGRVLVQAFPLGVEWSNVPLLKAYVVMVHDWLGYVTAPTTSRYNLEPGTTIVASSPVEAKNVTAEMVTPRGRAIPLTAADAEFAPTFRYSQTTLPGTYRVRFKSGNETLAEVPFQVARDAQESDLKVLDPSDRERLAKSFGVRFDEVAETAPSTVVAAPRREPVWGALLVALVALLVAELFVANLLARQRHGFEVSPA